MNGVGGVSLIRSHEFKGGVAPPPCSATVKWFPWKPLSLIDRFVFRVPNCVGGEKAASVVREPATPSAAEGGRGASCQTAAGAPSPARPGLYHYSRLADVLIPSPVPRLLPIQKYQTALTLQDKPAVPRSLRLH